MDSKPVRVDENPRGAKNVESRVRCPNCSRVTVRVLLEDGSAKQRCGHCGLNFRVFSE